MAVRGRGVKAAVHVLLSGGIDSAALLSFYLRQKFRVAPLFVDFGQAAGKQELRAARSLCKFHGLSLSVVSANTGGRFAAGYVPGRNAFLLFTAMLVSQEQSGVIAIGIHERTSYYDCSEGFLKAVQAIIDGYSAGRLKVAAPFLKWDKPTIWAYCRKYRVPVRLTYSCENGSTPPCGKCLSCKDREALRVL